MTLDQDLLAQAATIARGLAIDAVHASSSGHLGLPLGCAELGAVLFGHALQYDPRHPRWINRDRFILSAGHGSMFLYAWLHLAGFDLPMEEIERFRQLHSITPGHPEFNETPGVEATTGPLGQGIGNAVGFAIAAQMAAARFNTPQHTILNYHVVALAGDGCMQEGVSSEAASLAGHLGLDNLILLYDSNDVTLDAMASVTQSEDTAKRFQAYGFDVQTVADGHNMVKLLEAFERAKHEDNGRPKLIIVRTEIGRGIPEIAGTSSAHGESGAKYAAAARKALGLPEKPYYVSEPVRAYFKAHQERQQAKYQQWESQFHAWQKASPELAQQLERAVNKEVPADLLEKIPLFGSDYQDATRGAGGVVMQTLAQAIPELITGSADLFGSTKNYIKEGGDFSRDSRSGRNVWFGIREHAMGAIMNGVAYDGLLRPSGATFTVFADYMRPAIRLASLSGLPVIYIFTHDSVGVGEDGPTHQPVETAAGLRVIPNLDVIRPADPEEVAGAFVAAITRREGPTALLLTRQKVPTLHQIPAQDRRQGAIRGAYIARRESQELTTILMATGSELQLALEAADVLGAGTRVVSIPCMERFDRQEEAYREEVLPSSCTRRVSIEAGVTGVWPRYVGPNGRSVAIDRFGMSAPGATVLKELGITSQAVVQAARELGA